MRNSGKTYKGASRARSCEGKSKFNNRKGAHRAMMAVKHKREISSFMRVYACKFCGAFHYGHVRGEGASRADRIMTKIDQALAKDARLKEKCGTA